MPKVTPEYTENKKKMIVDAAYNVCLRKPAEMVTISDVIAETGLSQGAIYRYYNGLDDIFADMVSRMRTEYDIITPMEELIKNDYSFEEITFKIFDILAEAMKAHLLDVIEKLFRQLVDLLGHVQSAIFCQSLNNCFVQVGNRGLAVSAVVLHIFDIS